MINYLKENFRLIVVTLWTIIAVVSTWYNHRYSDEHIEAMTKISNLVTQGIGEADKSEYKISYVAFAYYSMSYYYYAPYEDKKSTILNNMDNNNDFIFLGKYLYHGEVSIKYCYGIYNVNFSEMTNRSYIVIFVNYSKQSDCYKKYKK
ncbi:MAG: hypothetical protein Q4B88_00825 [Moraxella sp.]|nr:hypothetical protein [Moraxella sp.]